MTNLERRLTDHPVARVAVEITGLKPLWLPAGLVDALPHRVITVDLARHLALKGVLARVCYNPLSGGRQSQLWGYLQVHPTLLKVRGTVSPLPNGETLVSGWSIRFGLLLPLGLFNIEHPVIRTEIGNDPVLYTALSLAEIGRSKGLLRTNNDYGMYTVTRWEALEISRLAFQGAAWVKDEE